MSNRMTKPVVLLLCAALLPAIPFACAQDTQQPPAPTLTAPPPGVCTDPRPQICPEIYMPVCGYDKDGKGRTYPNYCHACAHAEVVRYTSGKCKVDQ